jgi:hypothetical protein
MLNIILPLPRAIVLAVSTILALSGWFFRHRATRPNAQPAGLAGAIQLGAVLVALMGSVALVLLGVLGNAGAFLK